MGWAVFCLCPLSANSQQGDVWHQDDTFGEVAYLTLNGAVAGLSAGLVGVLEGRDFTEAFFRGMLGGTVVYGGKRLVAAHFDGAGLIGRQVSAVGVSMVRNAAEGRGTWDRLVMPVGPFWLYMEPHESLRPQIRVNVVDAWKVGFGIARPELEIDWRSTLSGGTPVFVATNRTIVRDGRDVNAVTGGGVIYVEGFRRFTPQVVLAHERVHVLQHDFIGQVWSAPLDRWLVSLLPEGARRWFQYVDLSTIQLIKGVWPIRNMQEAEASFLEHR